MARTDDGSRARRVDALGALLESGDHGGARAEGRRRLADAGASREERAEAEAVLRSLRPEPAAVVVGAGAAALAAAVTLWALLGGR
ncbi:hypothetical protein [Anaeromyxobacter oryzae]|uniref:Uncharacterized protein n=1 Tax=Anaeromyxobacter oryzae TaxID=2918170 RepID=A0ABM7X2V4_9BACT|nr:hypothetical protein [Anaeromyxobacter oryzae]BDG06118.1 hypothetical protein AMOR_51140 [Anaeromyxobacter oryzae]